MQAIVAGEPRDLHAHREPPQIVLDAAGDCAHTADDDHPLRLPPSHRLRRLPAQRIGRLREHHSVALARRNQRRGRSDIGQRRRQRHDQHSAVTVNGRPSSGTGGPCARDDRQHRRHQHEREEDRRKLIA